MGAATVRYIHAADLHLDAAFVGISREAYTENLGQELHKATFVALDRLVALCLQEKPHFLVLAGDIYNAKDQSLKAQLALRDACLVLAKNNIAVYIVHGNHDPLSSRLQMLHWPENVHTFGADMEDCVVRHQEKPIAIIHGISHVSEYEGRNLAKEFQRRKDPEFNNLFQLGLLHCTLENAKHSDRYAPCTLDDLQQAELDAWALGHVHEKKIIQKDPLVVYAGNTQGLHINEVGARGCYLVTAKPKQNGGFHTEVQFHTLGPVVWEKCLVSLEDVQQLDTAAQQILEHIDMCKAQLPISCSGLIVRIILTGRTVLDGPLRNIQERADLLQYLRTQLAEGSMRSSINLTQEPQISIKDIQIETSPLLDFETLRGQDDLLGETLRYSQKLLENDQDAATFVQNILDPLFAHPKARHILVNPDSEEIQNLLKEAERLCADSMESR